MEIETLKRDYLIHQEEIESRMKDFLSLNQEKYVHELMFCILTPQSNAEKCWSAVENLKDRKLKEEIVTECLKTRTRFYKNKSRYLIEATKKWPEIKKQLESNNNPLELREYIVKNIKGLGLKEASHFLRNIGKSNNQLAILDRHILRQLEKLGIIEKIPSLNKKSYLEIEQKMKELSEKTKIPLDHLDLLFWKVESGRIFK